MIRELIRLCFRFEVFESWFGHVIAFILIGLRVAVHLVKKKKLGI